MRLLLPLADRYHDEVAQLVGRALDHPVAITGLGASWHGFGPSIELEGVTVFDDKGQPLLQCAAARVDVALLASLRSSSISSRYAARTLPCCGARTAVSCCSVSTNSMPPRPLPPHKRPSNTGWRASPVSRSKTACSSGATSRRAGAHFACTVRV